jgi:glycosyltransferase involved in cell wall biosynthesis
MTLAVSVALCTRNGAAHIEEQLLSILGQSVLPDEVIVSDDASTDGTVDLVRAVFASPNRPSGGPRLVVIQNPDALGVTRNFEQALRACHGDLIALCDQDDIWHPDRLRVAIDRFETSADLQMLASDARLIGDAGQPLRYSLFEALEIGPVEQNAVRSGEGFEALLKRNLVTGATSMVRRELVARAAPFPEPWVHDEWLAAIAAAIGSLNFVSERLIDYRQHSANQIGVRKLGLVGKFRQIIEPRDDRNRYLFERARALSARLEELGDAVPLEYRELARRKVEHERLRAGLAVGRPRRWRSVLREATTGNYSLFGRGAGDILRDLFQPAGTDLGVTR